MTLVKKYSMHFLGAMSLLAVSPAAVWAQAGLPPGTGAGGGVSVGAGNLRDVNSFIAFLESFLNAAIGILVAVMVVVLVYRIFQYVMASGEDRNKKQGDMVAAFVGLILVFVFWGIINLVLNTFGGSFDRGNITPPSTINPLS